MKVDGKVTKGTGDHAVTRVNATAADDADLGSAADKVGGAETPHKGKAAPGLTLVLFAKFDKEAADKAVEALGKVKGVDAKGSSAKPDRGEIHVKFSGGDKVTAKDLLDALKEAGVTATTAKTAGKKKKD